MLKKIFTLLFVLISVTACKKETENLKLTSTEDATNLKESFKNLTKANQWQAAENVAKKQLENVQKSKNFEEIAEWLYNIGLAKNKQEKYTEALDYFLRAYALEKNFPDKKYHNEILGDLLNKIGVIYFLNYQYQKALLHYKDAVTYFEKTNDLKNLAICYRSIGLTYAKLENWHEAIQSYEKATKLLTSLNLEENLIKIYQDISVLYIKTSDYSKALIYAKKGLALNQKYSDEVKLAKTYTNIGIIYSLQEKFDLAKKSLEKSLVLKQKIGDETTLPVTYNNLGYVYLQEKNYALAEDYLLKAEILAQEADLKEDLVETYEYLSELYATKGDANKTLGYYKKYTAIKEELNQSEKLSFSQGITETLKAEQAAGSFLIKDTPSNHNLPYFIAFGAILLAIFGWGKNVIASKKRLKTALIFAEEKEYKSTLQFKALEADNQDKYKSLQQENERLMQAQAKMKEAIIALEKVKQKYLELQVTNLIQIKESEEFQELYRAFAMLKQLHENTNFVLGLHQEKNAEIIKALTEAELMLRKYEIGNPYLVFLDNRLN